MNTPRHQFRSSTGFTLVEVLVALLVISIGLLGVAKLVLAAVKANDSAYFRGQATDLAYEILDNMRANHAYALMSPGYGVAYGDYANPGFTCLGAGNTCTPQQIAAYDLYMWKSHLNPAIAGGTGVAALPSGDGQVQMCFPSITGCPSGQVTATITIEWDDSVAQWAFGAPPATTPAFTTFTLESAL
ncbi:MAG: type IV pilus modification protein PilV [Steroidobacteraceae bacterium]